MREIKFRGKLVNSECWIEGDYYYNHETNEHRIISGVSNGEILDRNVQPDTVGQFTGLHDRVGNEIYEGDILEYCTGIDSFGAIWQTARIEYRINEGGYVGVNQYCKTRDGREIVQNIVRCLNKCIVRCNIYDEKGGD